MTLEEVLKIIKDGRIAAIIIRGNNEDETKFNQENIEALNVIAETIHEYQKIKEIISKWDVGIYDDEGLCDVEVLEMISSVIDGEVLEDGKID